jgi:DNA (cytosine-5)-methyltransferase 1
LFIVATRLPLGLSSSLEAEKLDVYGNLSLAWEPDDWRAAEFLEENSESNDSSAITKSESVVLDCWDDFVQILRHNSIKVPAFPIWTEYWGLSPQPSEFPAWKWSLVEKNLKFYAENKSLLESWARKWQIFSSSDFSPSKRKFEWQAGDMAKVMDGIIQFRPSGVRVKRPTYLPALVAITQTPIIGPLNRRLTVRDAASLQGLPRGFTFGNQVDSKSFKQLGNGVNVGVVWWVIRTAILRDRDLLSQSEQGRRILKLYRASDTSPDAYLSSFEPLGEQR